MIKPVISVVDRGTIRIRCPELFRADLAWTLERLLHRIFAVEAIRSVELMEASGTLLINLRRPVSPISEVLARLASSLSDPVEHRSGAGFGRYVVVKRQGGRTGLIRAPRRMKGVGRWIFRGVGYGFLGLAAVGVVSPFLPTTPIELLSSYFFLRSTPAAAERLLGSRLFGPILRDWYLYGAMRRSLKGKIVLVMVTVLSSTVLLVDGSSSALPIMVFVSLLSVGLVMRIPTLNEPRDRVSPPEAHPRGALSPAAA